MKPICKHCGKEIPNARRSTKQFCNKNCKQLAYYYRKGNTQSLGIVSPKMEDKVKLEYPLKVKENFTLIELKENNSGAIEEETPSENKIPNEELKKEDKIKGKREVAPATVKAPTEKEPYHWINSTFLEKIENLRAKSSDELKFRAPREYWSGECLESVAWITTRLRCLAETVIKLSNFPKIDKNALMAVSTAFSDFHDSVYFQCLPANYPFINFIPEWRKIFENLVDNNASEKYLRFKLSTARRAELIHSRFIIGNSVNKKKFSELNFSDGIRDNARKKSEQTE